MSNRNFNASVITQRLANKAVAKNVLSNMKSGNPYFFQPQSGNFNTSIINQVGLGNSMFTSRGPTCTTIDPGCPCPIFNEVIRTSDVQPPINNNSGISQFAIILDGNGNTADEGFSTVVDSEGNFYVVGTYSSSSTTLTIQNAVTSGTAGTNPTSPAITLPSTGAASQSLFLIKYTSTGTAIWATYFGAVTGGNDVGYSVAVDSDDNVYIGGYYTSLGTVNIKNGATSGTPADKSPAITLPVPSGEAVCLIKYNSAGVAQWATYLDGTGTDRLYSIAIDSSNNVYVTGTYTSTGTVTIKDGATSGLPADSSPAINLPSTSNRNIFLIKYNSAGEAQWATDLNGTGFDEGQTITIDSSNNIYIGGTYTSTGTVTIKDGATSGLPTNTSPAINLPSTSGLSSFLIKYDSSGEAQWATNLNAAGTDILKSVTTDSANNVYAVGYYVSSSGSVTIQNGATSGLPTNTSPALNLPITSVNSGYLIKYNSAGEAQWATILSATGDTRYNTIILDSLNNIYVSGFYTSSTPVTVENAVTSGTAGANPTNPPITLLSSTANGVLLIKYNSDGVGQWATCLIGTSLDAGNSLGIDSSNNLYLTGLYTSTGNVTVKNVDGNSQTDSQIILPATTNGSMFLIKYI